MTCEELEEAICTAETLVELEALVDDLRKLPEDKKAKLRGPYRAARELFKRIAAAPAEFGEKSTFRDGPKP